MGSLAPFEWLTDFEGLKATLEGVYKLCKHHSPVLSIGCGTSRLGERLLDLNFKDVHEIDISPTLIAHRKAAKNGVKYDCCDCRTLSHFRPESHYYLIIDKGTIDALLCGENGRNDVTRTVSEVYKALQPGGVFVCVSHAAPESRLDLFEGRGWSVRHQELARQTPQGPVSPSVTTSPAFVYCCVKPLPSKN